MKQWVEMRKLMSTYYVCAQILEERDTQIDRYINGYREGVKMRGRKRKNINICHFSHPVLASLICTSYKINANYIKSPQIYLSYQDIYIHPLKVNFSSLCPFNTRILTLSSCLSIEKPRPVLKYVFFASFCKSLAFNFHI